MASKKDGDAMKAKMQLQFTNLNALVKQLEDALTTVGGRLPRAVERGLKDGGIRKEIAAIGAQLDSAVKEDDFKTIQMAMANAATSAEKIGRSLSAAMGRRAAGAGKAAPIESLYIDKAKIDRTISGLNQYAAAQRQVAAAQQRTVLMSQNMLRVIQDAPFGMLGMANNIQMLAENFSTARAKGFGFTETLKAGLKGLIMGPMSFAAVVAIATIVIQKWDAIVEKGTQLKEMLSGVAEAQRDLNKAMREGTNVEAFGKKLEDATDETLDQVRNKLLSEREAALAKAGIANTFQVEDELEKWRATRIGQFGFLNDAQQEEVDRLKSILDIEERLRTLYHEKNRRLAEDALNAEFGFENRRQDELDKIQQDKDEQRKKELDDAKKTAERILKQERDLWYESIFGEKEYQQQMLEAEINGAKAREKAFWAGLEARRRAKRQEMAEARRNAAITNAAIGQIMGSITSGEAGMRAMGTGMMPLESRAGFGEQEQRLNLETTIERAKIAEKIDLRREAMSKLVDLETQEIRIMGELHSAANAAELIRIREQKEKITAEVKALNEEEVALVQQAEAKKIELRRQAQLATLESMSSIAGGMSGIFGDMTVLFAEQSEKGMKQHRGFMKAAAFADAIAAGIAVYRNTVQAMKGNPLAPVVAGVAMAGVITGLMAKIRQIDNPTGGGGGGGAMTVTGRWTALNSGIVGQRANDFATKQNQLASSSAAGQAASMQNSLDSIASRIADQRVVIDSATSAEVSRMGAKQNTRRVQTSN